MLSYRCFWCRFFIYLPLLAYMFSFANGVVKGLLHKKRCLLFKKRCCCEQSSPLCTIKKGLYALFFV